MLLHISSKLLAPVSAQELTIGALACLLFWITFSSIKQWYRLRHFNSPWHTSWSKFWLVKTAGGPIAYLKYFEMSRTYGLRPISRIGPNNLLVSDPNLMRYIVSSNSPYRRSDWYNCLRFNPESNNLVSQRDDTLHRELRARMAPGYSGREVQGLEQSVDRNTARFVRLLKRYAVAGEALDAGMKIQFLAMDVIIDIAFGEAFGFLESGEDVYGHIESTKKMLNMIVYVGVFPWLAGLIWSPVGSMLMPKEKQGRGFQRVKDVAKKVASERYGPDRKTRKDMLGLFVARGLSQKESESEILLQLIAGSDPTGTAIRTTILHAITTPRILSRLQSEISHLPITSIVSDSTARRLPYLQAAIKEGLRLYPPITNLQSKEAPPEELSKHVDLFSLQVFQHFDFSICYPAKPWT